MSSQSTLRPHRGSFVNGQNLLPRHPENHPRGDFAAGSRDRRDDAMHEGTFAQGQSVWEHHPENHRRGDFAAGQRVRRPRVAHGV